MIFICKKIHTILKNNYITKMKFDNNTEDKLNSYLSSKNNFFRKKSTIIAENKENNFSYYNEFIILDKDLYNEMKDDKGVTHNFQHEPKTANIFIYGKNFIHKIKDNV